jgi:hypothetical protein
MGRFGNLVGRRLRIAVAATPRQAQPVLVICTVEITGAFLKDEQYRAMQARYCDLQQQSDRGENLTETAQITRTPGRHILISPLIDHRSRADLVERLTVVILSAKKPRVVACSAL